MEHGPTTPTHTRTQPPSIIVNVIAPFANFEYSGNFHKYFHMLFICTCTRFHKYVHSKSGLNNDNSKRKYLYWHSNCNMQLSYVNFYLFTYCFPGSFFTSNIYLFNNTVKMQMFIPRKLLY